MSKKRKLSPQEKEIEESTLRIILNFLGPKKEKKKPSRKEDYTCHYCDGSGTLSNGDTCGDCNGAGKY